MKLNKTAIDKLEYQHRGPSQQLHWDEDQKGFGVRVSPTGSKCFVVGYRVEGRWRLVTIGHYGRVPRAKALRGVEPMTPTEARRKAKEVVGRAASGNDVAEQRRELREAPTVADLAKQFSEDHASRKAASTRRNYELLWRRWIVPRLGRKRVAADVTWEDFAALHADMPPYQGNRMLALGSVAWKLATRWGWWPRDRPNPARDHDRNPEPRNRGRALTETEIRAIGRALRAEPAGSIPAACLRVLMCMTSPYPV